MKKYAKFLMAAIAVMAFAGLSGCNKDDDKSDNPGPRDYTESSTFSIMYDGNAVAAGDTVTYNYTVGMAVVNFNLVNKTQKLQEAYFMVEFVEGDDVMKNYTFCTDLCYDTEGGRNTFSTPNPFELEALASGEFHFQFMNGAPAGSTALYRLTVGSSDELLDPQVIFVRVNL